MSEISFHLHLCSVHIKIDVLYILRLMFCTY